MANHRATAYTLHPMNHSATFCKTLSAVPIEDAINAAHQALMQLEGLGDRCESARNGVTYDNRPAIAALRTVMVKAGHVGFID